ncbi:threonine--tRNA ligase, partial [bacterium I07]
ISVQEILDQLDPKSAKQAIAAILDDSVVDLSTPVENDAAIQVIRAEDPQGKHVLWHSASHVMAQAVQQWFPGTELGIGPSIDNGFYYDFRTGHPLSTEDFDNIESNMQQIIDQDQPFVRKSLSKAEAIDLFQNRNEPFKIELIENLPGDHVSVYQNGSFVDLCRGPHVPSTGFVKHFKLLSLAGAYWHGDERNPVMQRIYGIAFPDPKSLRLHLQMLDEAKKRDHRRLAKDLDLFSFHQEGPGFPFWHPNGMILYNQVMDYMREVLEKHSYDEVKTPIILNEELWHKSGHWDNYKENMYFTEIDEQPFAVKPMNCPGGLLVYSSSPHSYRELPIKLSEMGLVHRHEKSGVLHGLFRVRQFTQDDAHVFCTPDQMEDEVIKLIDLVDEVYQTFGYSKYDIELSTRPAKSIGSHEMWELAEKTLSNALNRRDIAFQVNQGEGAFYGPKIDYHIQDSLGRMWQCGTIQVDFSMPERFGLEYVGDDGEKHQPVMIHRAILGSVERFIGILIEHYGGAFPAWLAPVQVVVIPISEKHHDYGLEVHSALRNKGIRVYLDQRNEKVGYKIREAETKKIPYMFILGDKEITNHSIALRIRRQGDQGEEKLTEVIEKIKDEIDRRK